MTVPGLGLGELFGLRASRRLSAPALTFRERVLTYRELNEAANRVAHRLRALGVRPEVRVGISLERGPDAVVAMLGVLKAGGAYVPLDPAYPAERLRDMVDDAGISLVLDSSLLDAEGLPADDPAPVAGPQHAAYVIFTSGSTGRPKGVLVEHGAVVDFALSAAEAIGIGEDSRTLAAAALSFDASTLEVFCALLRGAHLHMASEDERASPERLGELVRRHALTEVFLAPALLPLLDPDLPHLRAVASGGEAAVPEQVERWTAGGRPFFNLYGPTEITVAATLMRCEGRVDVVPIGTPMANHRTYVLDGDLRAVGTGELYLAGAGLARCYVGRPDLTAERFLPDPFAAAGTPGVSQEGVTGARMYRTGDLARWNADGLLEFAGRADRQLKVRGFRVEPGEIEAALERHPGVERAVVEARHDARGELVLAAYVTGAGAPDLDGVRRHLAGLLPPYMLPQRVVGLDRFPLTPSAKIDRAALSLPELTGTGAGAASETERVLVEIWREVLGLTEIGVDREFLELGGHSLHAARILARVERRFERRLEARDLFAARTVAGLAARIDAAGEVGDGPPLGPRPAGLPAVPTSPQRALWFIDRLNPDNPAYNMTVGVRLRGRLDLPALEAALARVAERHEAFRSRFPDAGGEPRVELGAAELPLVLDAGGDPERWLEQEAARPFDLAHGPIARARLLRVADDDHVLAVSVHHIAFDGWSLHVLLRDLAELYAAEVEGRPADLPELPLTYTDFAAWQRQRLQGEALDRLGAHWRERLQGAPQALELPADRPRPPLMTYRGERRRRWATPDLSDAVRTLARTAGTSVFATLLAGFLVVLQRLSGEDDLVVGAPIAWRDRAELEQVVGYCLNSLPVRTDVSGDPTFAELARRAHDAVLDAVAHSEVPFERLVEELRPPRDMSRTPLFQVLFNMYNFPEPRLDLPGLRAETLPEPTPGSFFDLTVYVAEDGDRFRFEARYNPDLFDAARMDELLGQLLHVLAQVTADPERRIGSCSLVTQAARAVLPDPAAPLDASWRGSVPELFAAAAERTPDAVAVAGAWTYAELADLASRLAGRLREAGVGRGDVVAIAARRRPELVLALLGTLWAGAAFTILDPAYPAARIEEQTRLARRKRWLRLDGDTPDPLLEGLVTAPAAPLPRLGPDDLAYIAFTSGSTGQPKGILGRHGPLTHFLPWLQREFGLGPDDRFSMLSGIAHDPLHRDVFTPLCLGARVCVPPPEAMGAGRLPEWLAADGVTVTHLTPALGQVVTEPAPGLAPGSLPGLRLAFFVGDVLTRRDVARLRALAPSIAVVNYYGSTETQRAVGCHVVADGGGQREVVPLGRGIEDVQLLVLNARGELAGIGERGEVLVRSPHLAAGYLGDPALTSERFLGAGADRRYRTGDVGRYRPDGDVEPLGRADRQVKVRGHRVEIGEIEAVLGRHPGVREAVVSLHSHDRLGQRLVAHVVETAPVGDADLREHLRLRLPDYMVPTLFVRLSRLPLTPNGKVDHAALTVPEGAGEAPAHTAPLGRQERDIAEVWREVLGRQEVGVEQNFFDLGGNSLAIVQVQVRLERRLGRRLSVLDLIRHPSIAELARFLARSGEEAMSVDRGLRRAEARAAAYRGARRRP
jgi:amino acid adenylation domain-containing protein